jgi:hypothetical protein
MGYSASHQCSVVSLTAHLFCRASWRKPSKWRASRSGRTRFAIFKSFSFFRIFLLFSWLLSFSPSKHDEKHCPPHEWDHSGQFFTMQMHSKLFFFLFPQVAELGLFAFLLDCFLFLFPFENASCRIRLVCVFMFFFYLKIKWPNCALCFIRLFSFSFSRI